VSHFADNLGRKLLVPELDNFMRLYHQLFSHSLRAKVRFKERFNEVYVSFSAVRWWSVWEQDCQILRLWPGLCTWFIEDQDLDTKSAAALAAMLSALEGSARLYLQLAVSVHFCKPWVQFTYKFEADTFQADLVYDALQDLTRRVQGDVSQLVAILRCLCSIFFPRGSFQNLRSAAQSRYLSWTLSFNVWQPEAHLS